MEFNFFNSIQNLIINWIFNNKEFYQNYLGTLETDQTKLISFIIDIVSFGIPFLIISTVFIIPIYFLFKAFNRTIRQINTNVITEESGGYREKRKKK